MSFDFHGPLVVAGAGKMGAALIKGLLERGLDAAQLSVQEPMPSDEVRAMAEREGFALVASVEAGPRPPAALLVAVKPQLMDEVFPKLARLAGPDTVTISIAAGRSLASFAAHLPKGAAIVRAMPNTPAAIGRGMTVACANASTGENQRRIADMLLGAVGRVAWIGDESLMNAVTAISGSGPAYVFLLAEAMAAAGERLGLDPQLALKLARETVAGAGALLVASSDSPEVLRRAVTSPGGTTAAALEVLMAGDGLVPLMMDAAAAAEKRGRELAG